MFSVSILGLAVLPFLLVRSDSQYGVAAAKLCTVLYVAIRLLPLLFRLCGILIGKNIRGRTQSRRELLLERAEAEEKESLSKAPRAEDEEWEKVEARSTGSSTPGDVADRDWRGVVGFFHPFCNAGGGGERVLWAAIRATQKRYPRAICVVYTGDHDVDKATIIQKVEDRFNIQLHAPTITFLYLSTRHYVLSSTWPHFTLAGQSIGSLILAHDAFNLLVPDIFVDTMGYAFALALSKFYFPWVPTGAYVHYPTISTDMLSSLSASPTDKEGQTRGVNAGTGHGVKGTLKRWYWILFARLYSYVGGFVDVVMTNSTWTQNHMQQLWGPRPKSVPCFDSLVLSFGLSRGGHPTEHALHPIEVVFPPVAVEEVAEEIEVSEATEAERGAYLLYIAQFRPEKNHQLILNAFAELLNAWPRDSERPKLILIGSVRNPEDATRVYNLRLLAHELRIKESVEFICDATWPQILSWLRRASVGVNGMWNEHFGIGVVEYQAAGLISVVNDSGGPKLDIVVEIDGRPTGFHATTAGQFAQGFRQALTLSRQERLSMRLRARRSAGRFTEEAFGRKWLVQLGRLVELQQGNGAAGAEGAGGR